jgi:hypothetical protein
MSPTKQTTHNNSVVTQESLRFTLRDLATPILSHKRVMSLTFLFIAPAALLLAQTSTWKYTLPSFIPLLPAHSAALTILIAIIVGLLTGLSLTYLVDYRDACFHTPTQVLRALKIPLVIAIPKRNP